MDQSGKRQVDELLDIESLEMGKSAIRRNKLSLDSLVMGLLGITCTAFNNGIPTNANCADLAQTQRTMRYWSVMLNVMINLLIPLLYTP